MAYGFMEIVATPGVKAAQEANGSRAQYARADIDRAFDRFRDREAAFIAARDSFYMATTSETGWPYVQHRGGPAGFIKVLDEKTLGFPDFRGNRQYITLGNIATNDRASLFLMDYPNRARLKILGRLSVADLKNDVALAEKLATPGYRGLPERAFLLRLEAFDWNCSQHITPRFTEGDINEALKPVRERIVALETENEALREKLAAVPA